MCYGLNKAGGGGNESAERISPCQTSHFSGRVLPFAWQVCLRRAGGRRPCWLAWLGPGGRWAGHRGGAHGACAGRDRVGVSEQAPPPVTCGPAPAASAAGARQSAEAAGGRGSQASPWRRRRRRRHRWRPGRGPRRGPSRPGGPRGRRRRWSCGSVSSGRPAREACCPPPSPQAGRGGHRGPEGGPAVPRRCGSSTATAAVGRDFSALPAPSRRLSAAANGVCTPL